MRSKFVRMTVRVSVQKHDEITAVAVRLLCINETVPRVGSRVRASLERNGLAHVRGG